MGSSDLQLVFPVFIFVILLCFLGSFFLVVGDDVSLVDNPAESVPLPFIEGTLVGYNNTSTPDGVLNGNSEDWWQTIAGVALAVLSIGVTIIFPPAGLLWLIPAAGVGIGAIYTATGLFGAEAIKNIPVIGDIVKGLDFIRTAVISFGNLMMWGSSSFGGFPIMLVFIGDIVKGLDFIRTAVISFGNLMMWGIKKAF